jgi:hypothetical protein
MENNNLNWIASFIWGIADEVLRDSPRPTPSTQGMKR